jgi:hypothetical protein
MDDLHRAANSQQHCRIALVHGVHSRNMIVMEALAACEQAVPSLRF